MSGQVRKILLGQVIGTKMKKTAKVRVNRLQLDPFVTQYFSRRSTVFAHDPEEEAKLGDIVLVKELPIKRSENVKYQMDRIIYSLGNVMDPITGKKCDGQSYWNDDQASLAEERDSQAGLGERARTASELEELQSEGTPV
ncbi:small ribosomal subunit protein uS17m-like [Diadema antillarum]|uniref:small ribosomal subunit protein uS17m-like n=1 Tax=Diadema antillarum TaxID=105358 RepID=UPI003A8C1ED1